MPQQQIECLERPQWGGGELVWRENGPYLFIMLAGLLAIGEARAKVLPALEQSAKTVRLIYPHHHIIANFGLPRSEPRAPATIC